MRQVRFRRVALSALAISFILFGGMAGTAYAGQSERGADKSSEAPGQAKKDAPEVDEAVAAAEVETAQTTGGGQVCDGDPSGNSDNGGGANSSDPEDNYQHNCGGPSQNGAGDGNATGRPDAGQVGNADDKNPPGQAASGPSDTNNGFECDQQGRSNNEGNQGVGFGNPAHTPCTPAPPPVQEKCPNGQPMPADRDCTPDCPDGSEMPADGDCTPDCPDGSEIPASGVCATSTATGPAVQASVFGAPAQVLGVTVTRPAAAAAPATLGATGTNSMMLVQIALLLIALGAGLLMALNLRRPGHSAA